MKIKILVFDLDGTLLRTVKTISERTKKVLRQCQKARIKTVYATGRGSSAEVVGVYLITVAPAGDSPAVLPL